MFYALIMAVVVSLTTFYSGHRPNVERQVAYAESQGLAAEMDVYRRGVALHFADPARKGKGKGKGPSPKGLAKGLLPKWSSLASANDERLGSYRSDDGTIFVYARSAKAAALRADMLALSKNSMQVGRYRAACGCFQPFLSSAGGVGLPPGGISLQPGIIPDGSPVWTVHSN